MSTGRLPLACAPEHVSESGQFKIRVTDVQSSFPIQTAVVHIYILGTRPALDVSIDYRDADESIVEVVVQAEALQARHPSSPRLFASTC